MNPDPNMRAGEPRLHPFPEGWYFVDSRRTIEKKGILRKTWAGEQIIAWSDGEGSICVADAYCPHLGADLGPDCGGRVRGGRIVCPFHGFEFDVSGQCVATPHAPAPRTARLGLLETREINGLVFAWRGNGGRPPEWSLPEAPTVEGWSGLEFRRIRFPGHPQQTTENSVDPGHLNHVHHYDKVQEVGSVSVEGSLLKSCYSFKRVHRIAGIACFQYDVTAVVEVHGLGYSYVEICEDSIGMDSRLWVLATPVDGELVEITLASQVRQISDPNIVAMRLLPAGLRTRLINKIIVNGQKHDVMQDVAIWSRQKFRSRPKLCSGDGSIGKFRQYCKQFYPHGQYCSP